MHFNVPITPSDVSPIDVEHEPATLSPRVVTSGGRVVRDAAVNEYVEGWREGWQVGITKTVNKFLPPNHSDIWNLGWMDGLNTGWSVDSA